MLLHIYRAPLALALLMTAPAMAQGAETSVAAAPAPALTYPDTARGDTVDTQFGVDVADPYRWLEDDVRVNPEVAAWVAAENQVTDAYLDRSEEHTSELQSLMRISYAG